jgi:hypothetical protein
MEVPMTKLSSGAQALIDAADGGDEPTGADRARVRALLVARVAAGAVAGSAVASGVSTASAAAATGAKALSAGVLLKIIASGALVGTTVMGVLFVARSDPGAPGTSQISGASVSIAPSVTPAAATTGLAAREDAPTPAASAAAAPAANPPSSQERERPESSETPTAHAVSGPHAPARAESRVAERRARETARESAEPSPAPPPSARPPNGIEAETPLLQDAQRALREGRGGAALEILEKHDKTFADGALREERLATRVLALCNLGRTDEARAEAARFLREYPRSPLAARVKGSCAK